MAIETLLRCEELDFLARRMEAICRVFQAPRNEDL